MRFGHLPGAGWLTFLECANVHSSHAERRARFSSSCAVRPCLSHSSSSSARPRYQSVLEILVIEHVIRNPGKFGTSSVPEETYPFLTDTVVRSFRSRPPGTVRHGSAWCQIHRVHKRRSRRMCAEYLMRHHSESKPRRSQLPHSGGGSRRVQFPR